MSIYTPSQGERGDGICRCGRITTREIQILPTAYKEMCGVCYHNTEYEISLLDGQPGDPLKIVTAADAYAEAIVMARQTDRIVLASEIDGDDEWACYIDYATDQPVYVPRKNRSCT